MYTASKSFVFSAAHALLSAPDGDDDCLRVHGHNYNVKVTYGSNELDEHGFVVPFGMLDEFIQQVHERLDHQSLNAMLPEGGARVSPTTENLAYWIYRRFPAHIGHADLLRVTVRETDKNEATYEPA